MGINDNFLSLSSYRVNEIPRISVPAESVNQDSVREDEKPVNAASISIEPVRDTPRHANLDEVSVSFNAGEDYSYIGRDKDAELLDMRRAVSDMRQDTILQGYRYFVGQGTSVFQSEDGVVMIKPKDPQ